MVNDETLVLFAEETKEHLVQAEDDILLLESQTENPDQAVIDRLFRAVHSIKGGSSFLNLTKITQLAHELENVMDRVRKGQLTLNKTLMEPCLASLDLIGKLINDLADDSKIDVQETINNLSTLGRGETGCIALIEPDSSSAETDLKGLAENKMIYILDECGQPLFSTSEGMVLQGLEQGYDFFVIRLSHAGELKPLQDLLFPDCLIFTSFSYQPPNGQGFPLVFVATLSDLTALERSIEQEKDAIFPLPADFLLQADAAQIKLNQQAFVASSISSSVGEKQSVKPGLENVLPLANSGKNGKRAPISALPPAEKNKYVAGTAVNQENIRVGVEILDKLMTSAGELVLTRNQLIQAVSNWDKKAIETAAQRLDIVTYELQETIMSTRMQEVGSVFRRFKRVVRDLSAALDKKVVLHLKGEDVELDKNIIEGMSDPLTHLIRNAIDHGIETPEIRGQKGKNKVGNLKLHAYHEAGQVVIDIEDDGKGIDTGILKKKALEKGLYSPAEINQMGEADLLKFIFLPGFSTANQVSDISGRGVGMDVVYTNINKLGGVIEIETKLDGGTTFHIKLPLTLAIIPSIIISVNNEKFAFPQANLIELVRIPPAKVKERIEKVGDAIVIRLRNTLLPLVYLRDFLGIGVPIITDTESGESLEDRRKTVVDRRSGEGEHAFVDQRMQDDRRYHAQSSINVMVVRTGDLDYGIIVDDLLDTEEIVVKPLGSHVREYGYAGATILGDGKVALIVDVGQVAVSLDLQSQKRVADSALRDEMRHESSTDKQFISMLVFENSLGIRFAFPIEMIWRIDRIARSRIESVDEKFLVRYGNDFVQVFSVDDLITVAPEQAVAENDKCYILSFPIAGKDVGLIAAAIIDVVDVSSDIDTMTFHKPGIQGSCYLMDQLTMILDVFQIAAQHIPEIKQLSAKQLSQNQTKTIVLVEDSPCFRQKIKEFLERNGFKVIVADDGVEGLQTIETYSEPIDLVLSDIEMPNMDGIEMLKRLRANVKYQHLPVLALTSLKGEKIEEELRKAGFDDYMMKLDCNLVLQKVLTFIQSQGL